MSPATLLAAERALCIHTFHSTPGLIQRPNRWWIVDESYTPQEDDEGRLIVGSQDGYGTREEAEIARAGLILVRIGVYDLIHELELYRAAIAA